MLPDFAAELTEARKDPVVNDIVRSVENLAPADALSRMATIRARLMDRQAPSLTPSEQRGFGLALVLAQARASSTPLNGPSDDQAAKREERTYLGQLRQSLDEARSGGNETEAERLAGIIAAHKAKDATNRAAAERAAARQREIDAERGEQAEQRAAEQYAAWRNQQIAAHAQASRRSVEEVAPEWDASTEAKHGLAAIRRSVAPS